MPIPSKIPFLAAYLNHKECEIYEKEAGQFYLFVPSKKDCETTITISAENYVGADGVARSFGLEPIY